MAGTSMKVRHSVLIFLFFLSAVTYLDRVAFSVAGPRIQQDLGLSPRQFGQLVAAFTITYALCEIPSGALADRIGARSVLTRIVIWWSAFTSLTGLANSFGIMWFTRLMFGAGEAGAYPGANSSISRWFPSAERARAASIVWTASRLGGALTPFIVIPIQQQYGWRMSFYLLGGLGVVWAIAWYWWYRDHPSLKPGVTDEELTEIGTGRTAPQHHSLPWARVLRDKNYWMLLLMYHTYCWGSYFYLSWLHTWLQKGRGFAEGEMKFWGALPFIAGALGNLVGGFLSDRLVRTSGLRFGRCVVGSVGLAGSAVCMFAAGFVDDRIVAALAIATGYFFMDCMLPVAWAVCSDIGQRYAGAVSGSMNMAGQIGSFCCASAFGELLNAYGDYNLPLKVFSVFLLISAVLFTRVNPTLQLVPEKQPEPEPALTR
jgi:MFS transporter, ACS family, glucarate transporter